MRKNELILSGVTGLHLTFTDGANPWLCFGNVATIKKQLKNWRENYKVDNLAVTAGGILTATLTEKI